MLYFMMALKSSQFPYVRIAYVNADFQYGYSGVSTNYSDVFYTQADKDTDHVGKTLCEPFRLVDQTGFEAMSSGLKTDLTE